MRSNGRFPGNASSERHGRRDGCEAEEVADDDLRLVDHVHPPWERPELELSGQDMPVATEAERPRTKAPDRKLDGNRADQDTRRAAHLRDERLPVALARRLRTEADGE